MTTPDPFAGVPAPLLVALERRGFTAPTAVQRAVLDQVSTGRDLRISSQTGSGKTVALGFALAPDLLAASEGRAARRAPVTLVIVPTRELAMQVGEELGWLYAEIKGLRVSVVTGGIDPRLERRDLSRGTDIVVGTPGRLLDHVRGGALDLASIKDVILDEADHLLELGFRDELDAILEALPAERHSHLISATFPAQVQRLADRFQSDPLKIEGTPAGGAHADIEHVVHVVRESDTYAALVNVLLSALGERCLVFVARRADASGLAEKLAGDGFAALPLSGELPQSQRTRTLEAFRNGSVPIIVATDVAGRGIDVPDVATVIHADPPKNPEAYTHRSGRTGRAGRKGSSVLLVPFHAKQRARRLLQLANVDATWAPVPTSDQIRKAVTKLARRRMHEQLASGAVPGEAQVAYAKTLLEGRDPAELVASLLQLAEPTPCRAPFDIAPLAPSRDVVDEPAKLRRPARAVTPPPRQQAGSGFIRFFLNWGEQRGATAPRVTAHVCRRGGITGEQLGSIRVGPFSTTFEVRGDVANGFEAKASLRDPREPKLRIARHRDDAAADQQQATA